MTHQTDVLVIGSGLAGLALALKVAPRYKVTVISKEGLPSGNTPLAQGGIAAPMAENDHIDLHIQDTLEAGAGLCRPDVVRAVVEQASLRIQDLVDWGVDFNRDPNESWALTREGGHSVRRILHVEDHTGIAIHEKLLAQARKHPNIHFLENHLAVDLLLENEKHSRTLGPRRCLGAYIMDKTSGDVKEFWSKATVLATGGAGKAYLYTSNWSGSTGDGIAMAYRAGARVGNMEFMQFHPTCLFHPNARNFLLSEALRGEGGLLKDHRGHRFMPNYHKLAELAPRDIVARSIDKEMKKSGADCVFLDMTQKSEDELKTRFPMIFSRCLELGIHMAKEPIPVVPAAHYLCGGVLTDLNGCTDAPGLFALGETAFTGLHGANRLASNSLLECLVTAHNAAAFIEKNPPSASFFENGSRPLARPLPAPDDLSVVSHLWDEIRRLMWNYVGIVRSNRRLIAAQHRIGQILNEIRQFYVDYKLHPDVIELRNIAIVADLTVRCALHRKESRGIHFNLDYPNTDEHLPPQETILWAGQREDWL